MGLRIVVAADFARYDCEKTIKRDLEQDEYVDEVIGVGIKDDEKTPYPHVDVADARPIVEGRADRGIFCCEADMGMATPTSKVLGIRASTAHDSLFVERLILSSDVHVLCLGQRVIGLKLARRFARKFLGYEFDPSSYSKASADVLVEYENGSAGCQNCLRRLSKRRGPEKLARLPLSGIVDHT